MISATVTSGVANFSAYRSSLCNQKIGVLSPFSLIISCANLEIGCNGSSLISEPSTTGMYSSNKLTINRAKRVFACPRKPSRLMLCLLKIALSNSGITVFSYP